MTTVTCFQKAETARRTGRASLTFVVCLLLSSCSGMDERLQARIDANEGRVQQSFDSPETTGLLIVDVELRHQGSLSWGSKSVR